MTTILGIICVCLLGVISFVALYQWLHAIVAMLTQRRPQERLLDRRTKFLILIPAHNEEDGLPATLRSLSQLRYLSAGSDCGHRGSMRRRRRKWPAKGTLLERNDGPGGKGAAMSWATCSSCGRPVKETRYAGDRRCGLCRRCQPVDRL
ncbi:MAG: hypothetical protein U0361_22600 [Nitrospiraceae bacterium]